jgi:chromosome segregation ATPase
MPALVFEIIAALISMAGGSLLVNSEVRKALTLLFRSVGLTNTEELPYTEKMGRLTRNMLKASREMDELLTEFAQTAIKRKESMEKLGAELSALQERHEELRTRIDQLKDVPIPVAEEFARLTKSGESRSAKRDYVLFGMGVIVSTAIAIVLKLLGLG